MTIIDELNDAAKVLRAYVNGETSVQMRVESRLDQHGNPAVEFCANWGSVTHDGVWRWGCAFGGTIEACLGKAQAEIEEIKADKGRAQRELEQQAAALGFVLVKKPTP